MATNFSVQNDRQLFIYSYPTSWVKISILCILLNPIGYACSFQLQFHVNKMQMNTIVPELKVSKIHQLGNQHEMHRAHQSHYFYCLKISRIGSVHSRNIGWVIDQFHNAHGSVLMGLRDVYTARISRMQVNWNSYRPRWLCRSLKYQEMKSIIERMVPRGSENTWTNLVFLWGGGGGREDAA